MSDTLELGSKYVRKKAQNLMVVQWEFKEVFVRLRDPNHV
jgi:hypothetical protein